MKVRNYNYLIGKYITELKETKTDFCFITKDSYKIIISKFEPYCACDVGNYIDEIVTDGHCFGTILNIEDNIQESNFTEEEVYNECVYKGNVTFYFENGKINMKVHGEDNGYYGVSFKMTVYIYKVEEMN